MKKTLLVLVVVIVVAGLVVGCGGVKLPPSRSYVPSRLEMPVTQEILSADFAEIAPVVDGFAGEFEDAWLDALPITLTAENEDDKYEIITKATYDDFNVYFLFSWKDEKMNLGGKMWEMRERDGEKSWKFGSRLPKEDMLSVGFEVTPIEGFEVEGCNKLCHSGPNYMAGKIGELLDIWTWQAHETFITGSASNHVVGPLGAGIDDQADNFDTATGLIYLPGTLYPNKKSVASPLFIPVGAPQQIGNIDLMKPVPANLNTLPAETTAPYYIQLPGNPDIKCMASYNEEDGIWTVEMSRSLVTNSNLQVQFAHNPTEDAYYLFHLSVFDNQMGESHVYTEKPTTLEFAGK